MTAPILRERQVKQNFYESDDSDSSDNDSEESESTELVSFPTEQEEIEEFLFSSWEEIINLNMEIVGKVVACIYSSKKQRILYFGKVKGVEKAPGNADTALTTALLIDCFKKKLISTDNFLEERPLASRQDEFFALQTIVTGPLEIVFTGKGNKWEFPKYNDFKKYERLILEEGNINQTYTSFLCEKLNNEDTQVAMCDY